MKKNLTFKLGLFCAALVLVATCFVTNAWAKYTDTVTASDSARVAKFGFTVNELDAGAWASNTAITVFDTQFVNILADDDSDVAGEKLIAPGSHGDFTIEMTNSSEVTVKFELTAVDTNTNNIPLKWRFGTYLTEYDSLEECLEAATTEYNSWVSKSGAAKQSIQIYWEWKFENGADNSDTTLGYDGTAIYEVVISCTATQVAPY